MTYTPTTWTNETPDSTPIKYKITDDADGVIANSAKIEVVTGITPGTALNSTNMNHIEQGIAAVETNADTATTNAATAQTTANNAATAAAAAQTTANAAIPKSTVTAAGDLILASGSAAVTRLAKGTVNGSVLSMSSGGAVVWSAPIGVTLACDLANVTSGINNTNYPIFGTTKYSNGITVGSTTLTIPSGMGSNLPYLFTVEAYWDGGTSGSSTVYVYCSGANTRSYHNRNFFAQSGGYYSNWHNHLTGIFVLSPGDTVYLDVAHETGSTRQFYSTVSLYLMR